MNEHINAQQRGHRGRVVIVLRKGSQTRAGGYRAAQRGHKQERGL